MQSIWAATTINYVFICTFRVRTTRVHDFYLVWTGDFLYRRLTWVHPAVIVHRARPAHRPLLPLTCHRGIIWVQHTYPDSTYNSSYVISIMYICAPKLIGSLIQSVSSPHRTIPARVSSLGQIKTGSHTIKNITWVSYVAWLGFRCVIHSSRSHGVSLCYLPDGGERLKESPCIIQDN